jgi:quinol monooxygenase YgiN/predicted GNAT family acetyltransferase
MSQLQVIARYTVTFGNEIEVASLLNQLADATRAEPGNLSFEAYRQLNDEREIALLERYTSLDAFAAHRASEHYNDLVLGQIVPRLDHRVVETFIVDEASQFFPDPASLGPAKSDAAGSGAASSGAASSDAGSSGDGSTRAAGSSDAGSSDSAPHVVVRDNPESQTYDALVGDEIAGTMLYEHEGPRLVLTHTAVQNKFQHQGIATALIAAALDDIRAKGQKVTILCPLVNHFIDAHPQYADLIDAEHPGLTKQDASRMRNKTR